MGIHWNTLGYIPNVLKNKTPLKPLNQKMRKARLQENAQYTRHKKSECTTLLFLSVSPNSTPGPQQSTICHRQIIEPSGPWLRDAQWLAQDSL